MRKSLRRALLTLPAVVVTTLAGVSGTATAAPAGTQNEPVQTLSCSHSHSNKDSGSGRTTTVLRYRSGPHTNCSALGQAGDNTLIYYHCWTSGESVGGVSTWTWGRVAGTQREGWFSDKYLSNGGSTKKC
ncbi:hypothetical protein [Amycolatopsis keratiniphila]|uniref:hypothetical protein n=1 Tax=Amycolatopsis keratiniphila TaxID=129921 RepID=UPI000879467E|nr:hypothetical protein [Amycolatopsis keratiniphila]SDU00052.1 hypothetical protein SAMN04489733_0261 [Amycolatopsis keratiniphila]